MLREGRESARAECAGRCLPEERGVFYFGRRRRSQNLAAQFEQSYAALLDSHGVSAEERRRLLAQGHLTKVTDLRLGLPNPLCLLP
jgi:hypothetical protein